MVYEKTFTGFLSCFFALSVIFTSLVFAPVSAEGSGGVKFGVMSDLHFHDGTTGIDSNIYTMLNYYKEQNVDAILVLGDGGKQCQGNPVCQIHKRMGFGIYRCGIGTEAACVMGNHEYEKAYYKNETIKQAQQRYMTAYG